MSHARRRWSLLHRWLAFSIGVLFVLLGLSGSVITYEQEIDAWLNPRLMRVQPRAEQASIATMEAQVRAQLPAFAQLYAARLPHRDGDAALWFFKNADGARRQFTVDVYTGRVIGERSADHHLVGWIYEFHASLLMGLAGNVLLSVVAIAALVLLVSGLWLWAPRTAGQWRQALRVARTHSRDRLYFDLHRVSGAYASALLLLSAFTGIYMALPPLMEGAVSLVSPVTPWSVPTAMGGPPRLSLQAAVERAQQVFPDARPKVLAMDRPGLYEINLFHPQDRLWRKAGQRTVFIDAATGEVLRADAPQRGSGGDRFVRWMFPLHNGEAFGEISRAVVCFSGLVPLLLAIAGTALWARRLRNRRRGVALVARKN